MPSFPFPLQAKLVVALCVLHNIIRNNGGASDYWERNAIARAEDDDSNNDVAAVGNSDAQESVSRRRDEIAQAMWVDYQQYLQQRPSRRSNAIGV